MVKITFKYKDAYTNGDWNTQSCVVENVQQAKDFYGLGVDCEYRIISVEDLEKEGE